MILMPYVRRNEHNEITSLDRECEGQSTEFLPGDHAEIVEFLADEGQVSPDRSLLSADLAMIRVIEDVIDLLIARNLILFSDLPAPVQTKLLQKKGRREQLFGGNALMVDEVQLL